MKINFKVTHHSFHGREGWNNSQETDWEGQRTSQYLQAIIDDKTVLYVCHEYHREEKFPTLEDEGRAETIGSRWPRATHLNVVEHVTVTVFFSHPN